MKKFFSNKQADGLEEKLVSKEKEKVDRLEEEGERAKQDLKDLEKVSVERKRVENEIIRAAQEEKDKCRKEAEEKQRLLKTNLMQFQCSGK